ncbi:uncharacterized protein LOC143906185 isoform X2 [Temnothorax americanus]|uniref:uncharacterized protein LOC143906185 isoform X2 n=1 Tax=Temnothorax americanus TaxID=1964332 RepID=UPI0040694BF8
MRYMMIQQRIRKLNNPDTLEDENNQIHRTFFDILMETSRKENFTSERICDYVTTMLLTASDSISIAMNFVIFMLANFPKVQVCMFDNKLLIIRLKGQGMVEVFRVWSATRSTTTTNRLS